MTALPVRGFLLAVVWWLVLIGGLSLYADWRSGAASAPQAHDRPEAAPSPLCPYVITSRRVWFEDGEWREGPTRVVVATEAPCKPGRSF